MPNKINKIIDKFIIEISNLLQNRLKKVILYGSYAKGNFNKNSDIDIMILTDMNEDEIKKYRNIIREIACNIEIENDIVISPLLRNIEKYNNRIDVIPFYYNAQNEGLILYG